MSERISRRALSCLAGPALSQCDLARFRADRRKLPLFGGPYLLVLGIGGNAGKKGRPRATALIKQWRRLQVLKEARAELMSPHGQLLLRFLREPAWCTGLTRCEGVRYIEQYAGCSCGSAFGSRPRATVLFTVLGVLASGLDFIGNFPCARSLLFL